MIKTTGLSHRERFRRVVTHQETDRVVFDLCGSPQTQLDYQETKDALGNLLGFASPKKGRYPLDERILEAFDIDTRIVGGMPTPSTVHNRTEGNVSFDSYGIGYRMVNGHMEICHNPLKGCTLEAMLAYPMPKAEDIDPKRIETWGNQARYLKENTDYAVVAEHPVLGVFEMGCWLFGFDDYLYRLAGEPELIHAFSERFLKYQKEVIEVYYGVLGPYIDCTTSGDDFGMQTGPFMSSSMFDGLVAPYLKERIAHTRKYTDAFYKHHTCGSVHAFIPTLISCGVDILNPIQPGTYMMEPERLKKDFGGQIAFWGGVDTQHLLCESTPEQVQSAVQELLDIMSPTGFILSPAHCIQQDVPAENIVALYQAAKDFFCA